MYRLVGTYHLRTLQSRFPSSKIRSSLRVVMESKQEDITQPKTGEEPRQFTTVANVEGETGKFGLFNYKSSSDVN